LLLLLRNSLLLAHVKKEGRAHYHARNQQDASLVGGCIIKKALLFLGLARRTQFSPPNAHAPPRLEAVEVKRGHCRADAECNEP
jgi:hypothetical protein